MRDVWPVLAAIVAAVAGAVLLTWALVQLLVVPPLRLVATILEAAS